MNMTSCLFRFCADNLRNRLDHICCFGLVCNDGSGNNGSDSWSNSVQKKLGGIFALMKHSRTKCGLVKLFQTFFDKTLRHKHVLV